MSLRMGASEAGSKLWDWSMGSLEVTPNRGVHPRAACFISQVVNKAFVHCKIVKVIILVVTSS